MGLFERGRRKARGECVECGRELRMDTLTLSGEAGRHTLRLEGIPLLVCSEEGHPRRFPDMEFGERLLDGVFRMDGVTRTKVRWGKTRQVCRACGKKIAEPAGREIDVSDQLAFPDLPPFRLSISGPAAICPSCGREHVWGAEEEASLTDALADALSRGRIEP